MAQASALVAVKAASHAGRVRLPLLRIRERRLLLAFVDTWITGSVFLVSYLVWRAMAHPPPHDMNATPWAWILGAGLSWLFVSWLAGSYDLDVADRMSPSIKRTVTVAAVCVVECLAVYWLFPKTYPRPSLGFALGCVPAAILLWRGIYASVLSRPTSVTKIVFLGTPSAFEGLNIVALTSPYYRLVSLVSPSGAGDHDLLAQIERCQAHRVVVAPGVRLTAEMVGALTAAIERGIEVTDFNTAYEEIAGKVAVDHVGDHWLAALPTGPKTSSFEEVAMRLVDIGGAAVGCLLTAALFPVIALSFKLTSGGPVLFQQVRLGRGGKPFTMYKFRTMRLDAEFDGAKWADKSDPRVTRIGQFLRGSHLDELPQCWNVLKGDMSLVGPRPERPEFTEQLSDEIPFYRLRHSVRPGITGLKQIRVGYAASTGEHLEVLRHDLYYIKHRSLALNLTILAQTAGSVLGRDGR